MKSYHCAGCGKKVPRGELLEHLKSCAGGDFRANRGVGGFLGGSLRFLMGLLLAAAFGVGSWFLGEASFQHLASMRRLERVPAGQVRAILPGAVNLNGQARRLERMLKSPHTSTPCLYYRYVVERRERDSDGETRWVTETNRSEFVDFLLEDETGSVPVRPVDGVRFSVNQSFQTSSDDRRYSEYRIDAGAVLFIFGQAVETPRGMEVRFDQGEDYMPIISMRGEASERSGMAGTSVAACWLGLVLLAVALTLLIRQLRIHRILVYFSLLNILVVIYLVTLGLRMMELDLRAALDRIERHEAAAVRAIQRELPPRGKAWNGDWQALPALDDPSFRALPREQAARIDQIRYDFGRAVQRVRQQRLAFPERLLAPRWGIPLREPLPMPPELLERLAAEGLGFEPARFPHWVGLTIMGLALLVGWVCYRKGFRKVRFKRCIENLPTSPTQGAAWGLTELKGVVDLPASVPVLKGPLSQQPCVHYHYTIHERRRSGKNTTWVNIHDEKRGIPFLCRDRDGTMSIDPAGADIHTFHRSRRSGGGKKYDEIRFELGDPLYAIGECVVDPTRGDQLYLRKPEGDTPFILCNYTEGQIMQRLSTRGLTLLNVSYAGILLAALILFGMNGSFAATDYLAAAMVAPLFMTLVTLTLHYNDLVFLRERVRRNRANIDVSLKKRQDLVPALVTVARAMMEHESGVHESLASLRAFYEQGGQGLDGKELGAKIGGAHDALSKFLLRAEAYPQLLADGQTALVMRNLVSLENEIAWMRKGHNDAVETYNTRVQTFPDVLFAKIFGFRTCEWIVDDSPVIRVPPALQGAWEKKTLKRQARKGKADTGGDLSMLAAVGAPPAASVSTAEEDAQGTTIPPRAGAYAALLDAGDASVRARQLEAISRLDSPEVRARTETLFAELPSDGEDLLRFRQSESAHPGLRELSPSAWRVFAETLQALVDADENTSILEFTVQRALDRHVEAFFGLRPANVERYATFAALLDPVSTLLSAIAWAEETPENTARSVFETGASLLKHTPSGAFHLLPREACGMAALDGALEACAAASGDLRGNILAACDAAVRMGGVFTPPQALLLCAIADTLDLPRPAWLQAIF